MFSFQASFDLNFKWPTSNGKPPADKPACGFYNELCPTGPVQGNCFIDCMKFVGQCTCTYIPKVSFTGVQYILS